MRRVRVIRASDAGYGPGRGWVVQVRSVDGVWGDFGDPVPTPTEAHRKAARAEKGEQP